MTLLDELTREVQRVLQDQYTLDGLESWLHDHAQDIASTNDPALVHLAGRTWNLLSEYGAGSSEAYVRQQLYRALQTPAATLAPA